MPSSSVAPAVWSAVTAPDRFDRLEDLAGRHALRLGQYNLLLVLVRAWRRIIDVRVTGLAAEMTYYALISLIPLITAVGATLGFAERVLGPERVTAIEDAVLAGLGLVFEQELTDEVLAPLVEGLLREERTGVAVGGLLVALWLASRMFRAAIRALDDAYMVPERRGLVLQSVIGLGLALAAVVTLVVVLAMVVVGPLLGGGQGIAEWLGQAETARTAWAFLRWPVVVLFCVLFLAVLYQVGPNVENRWRECLPGAVTGTAALLGVAAAFQAYLGTVGLDTPDVDARSEAVSGAAQIIGVVLAGVLWLWLSSIVILSGGVLNAELARVRRESAAEADGAIDRERAVDREGDAPRQE
jgi:membrane protein